MYNYSQMVQEGTPIVINYGSREEDLTSIGIFISSILLSSGGCITMILAQLQKSKCKKINACGFDCNRVVEDV